MALSMFDESIVCLDDLDLVFPRIRINKWAA